MSRELERRLRDSRAALPTAEREHDERGARSGHRVDAAAAARPPEGNRGSHRAGRGHGRRPPCGTARRALGRGLVARRRDGPRLPAGEGLVGRAVRRRCSAAIDRTRDQCARRPHGRAARRDAVLDDPRARPGRHRAGRGVHGTRQRPDGPRVSLGPGRPAARRGVPRDELERPDPSGGPARAVRPPLRELGLQRRGPRVLRPAPADRSTARGRAGAARPDDRRGRAGDDPGDAARHRVGLRGSR